MTKRRTSKAYKRYYDDPIRAVAGDRVALGARDDEWPGWISCTHADGRIGWVPEAFLAVSGDQGVLLRSYAAIELSVAQGEAVEVLEDVSGWSWCRTGTGETGWLPHEALESE